jgi:thymidylate synthase
MSNDKLTYHLQVPDGDTAWRNLLHRIMEHGTEVSPRGQLTKEILHTNLVQVDMARPVVMTPERKLNYRFMCAEALWILNGSNRLEPLARFIKRFEQYSDDGVTLFGAYGPPIAAQIDYVAQALLDDRETRQAVLTIWRQNPPKSKDIPCTVAMSFSIRHNMLHQHVYMRSSDAWLGIPYDMFSFSMVGLTLASYYNDAIRKLETCNLRYVTPGVLSISMTSSHLYERDFEQVKLILDSPCPQPVDPVPTQHIIGGVFQNTLQSLYAVHDDLPFEDHHWKLPRRGDGK